MNAEFKHPASALIADPFNQKLIAEYMALETAAAAKQIEEDERLIEDHKTRNQTLAVRL